MASEMDLQTAIALMGTKITNTSGRNFMCSCPLAPWTHGGGHDDRPSMSIMIDSPHLYFCFACRSKGNIKNLAWQYSQSSGDQRAYEYIRGKLTDKEVQKNFYGQGTKSRFDGVRKDMEKSKLRASITEERFNQFRTRIPRYALERGMDHATIQKFEIGYNEVEKRMMIPIRDFKGKLVGWSGRDVTDEQANKYKHVYGFPKEEYLYGENFLDESVRIGYGVEGFLDVISLSKYGLKNLLANMGITYSKTQIDKIKAWFDKYIMLPDLDDKGQGLRCCIESGKEMLLSGVPEVGIVGVVPNELYEKRVIVGNTWLESDYEFRPVAELKGKDPGDWDIKDLKLAFSHLQWLKI